VPQPTTGLQHNARPTTHQYKKPNHDWWRGKDSNLRRQNRQIYSLIPLTAREPLQTEPAIMPTGNMDVKPNRLLQQAMTEYMQGMSPKHAAQCLSNGLLQGIPDHCGIAKACYGYRFFEFSQFISPYWSNLRIICLPYITVRPSLRRPLGNHLLPRF
jgi:hypothetical protein